MDDEQTGTNPQVLVNALTAHVGTGTNMSGLATYQDLGVVTARDNGLPLSANRELSRNPLSTGE
jgi:hypothetical protein